MSRCFLISLLSLLLISCQSASTRTWELPPGVKAGWLTATTWLTWSKGKAHL